VCADAAWPELVQVLVASTVAIFQRLGYSNRCRNAVVTTCGADADRWRREEGRSCAVVFAAVADDVAVVVMVRQMVALPLLQWCVVPRGGRKRRLP